MEESGGDEDLCDVRRRRTYEGYFYKFPCMRSQALLALCLLDVLAIIERT